MLIPEGRIFPSCEDPEIEAEILAGIEEGNAAERNSYPRYEPYHLLETSSVMMEAILDYANEKPIETLLGSGEHSSAS